MEGVSSSSVEVEVGGVIVPFVDGVCSPGWGVSCCVTEGVSCRDSLRRDWLEVS